MSNQLEIALEEERLLRRQIELQEGLPHLYGWKFYPWARKFFDSTNKMKLLCAANQISKSSTQIRQCIDWATNQKKWKTLWRRRPFQFWYLYPTKEVATIEFQKKWVTEFMPRGAFENDPVYGWKAEYRARDIFAVHFNSGVSVYFKAYSQDVQHLQTGTCDAIFCFVKGTQIATPKGNVDVSKISVGDIVHTHKGPRKVIKTGSREASVIEVEFSNGTTLTGTAEHPIWTDNRGWVNLEDLTEEDSCYNVPECETTSSWYYLKENCTKEIRKQKIPDPKIISKISLTNLYTSIFGKITFVEKFLKVTSSIMKTIIPSTMRFQISNFCQEPSTRNIINKWNGEQGVSFRINVANAIKNFLVEVPRKIFRVQKNVGLKDILSREGALYAIKSTPAEETKSSNVSVVKIVQIKEKQRVYNLEVEDAHTYYANGILTHNCDEELPEDLYDELNLRIAATDGYFSMVFTATLGQQMWADAIEGRGFVEKFTDALKLQVSMFDCLKYEDGSDSHWTAQRIQKIVNSCRSQNEVLRRVYGRFVKDSGLKYPGFDRNKNIKEAHPLPKGWRIYAGVDIGSGGASGHPAAIVFVAVSPDFKKGRVFKGWRGDGIETTAKDVFDKYLELRGDMRVEVAYYDWQSKDFFVIASRSGEAFVPADKSHDSGESILNVLFKNEMLHIYEDEELKKLSAELSVLNKATQKQKAKDDFTDALRYACTKVPWDWEAISSDKPKELKKALDPQKEEIRMRREAFMNPEKSEISIDSEFEEWNDYYGE